MKTPDAIANEIPTALYAGGRVAVLGLLLARAYSSWVVVRTLMVVSMFEEITSVAPSAATRGTSVRMKEEVGDEATMEERARFRYRGIMRIIRWQSRRCCLRPAPQGCEPWRDGETTLLVRRNLQIDRAAALLELNSARFSSKSQSHAEPRGLKWCSLVAILLRCRLCRRRVVIPMGVDCRNQVFVFGFDRFRG